MELSHLALLGLAVFGLLGLVAGVALAFAAVRFKVQVDPRIEAVRHALMGANCGGCSYPGCEAYAEAVVRDPAVLPDLCRPGGPEVAARVARLTGKALGSSEPVICVRRCVKTEGHVAQKYEYHGVRTCLAASLALGGPDNCFYACLGLGDCVRACPFGAMVIQDGLVRVDQAACTGCGVCVRTCPKKVLGLIPAKARVMVHCSSRDKGKAVMDVCEAGCIACAKCVKECPAQALALEDNKLVVDHAKCLAYGPDCQEACVESCPRTILRRLAPLEHKRGAAQARATRLSETTTGGTP